MMKYIKKAFKWYITKSAETYSWMPTGTLPPNIFNH